MLICWIVAPRRRPSFCYSEATGTCAGCWYSFQCSCANQSNIQFQSPRHTSLVPAWWRKNGKYWMPKAYTCTYVHKRRRYNKRGRRKDQKSFVSLVKRIIFGMSGDNGTMDKNLLFYILFLALLFLMYSFFPVSFLFFFFLVYFTSFAMILSFSILLICLSVRF